MTKLIGSIEKIISNEVFQKLFRYTFIGGLTTIVSFGTYWLLAYPANMDPNIANIISVICAVIFAYITNKKFVFRSRCHSIKELFVESLSFFSSRAITMGIEIAGLFLLYSYMKVDAMVSKIIVTIIVLILNYLLSQFLVFKE